MTIGNGASSAKRLLASTIKPAVLHETSWVTFGIGGSLVLTLISTKILSLSLGEAEYGRLVLAMTIPLISSQVIFGPLTSSAARHYAPYREAGRFESLIATCYVLLLAPSGLLLALCLLASVAANLSGSNDWQTLWLMSAIFAIGQGLMLFFNSVQMYARQRRSAAIQQILFPASRLGFGGGAALTIAPTAAAAAGGLAAGMLVVLGSQFLSFRRSLPTDFRTVRPSFSVAGDLWTFGKYWIVWGLFSAIQLASDVWALRLFYDDTTVGIYGLAAFLGSGVVALFGNILSQLVTPVAYTRAGAGAQPERIASSVRVVRLAAAAMAVITFVLFSASLPLGPRIAVAVSTSGYASAGVLLPWLIGAFGLGQVAQILSIIPWSLFALREYMLIRIIIGLAGAILNVMGSWTLGTTGVVAGLIITATLSVILIHRVGNDLISRATRPITLTQL